MLFRVDIEELRLGEKLIDLRFNLTEVEEGVIAVDSIFRFGKEKFAVEFMALVVVDVFEDE